MLSVTKERDEVGVDRSQIEEAFLSAVEADDSDVSWRHVRPSRV